MALVGVAAGTPKCPADPQTASHRPRRPGCRRQTTPGHQPAWSPHDRTSPTLRSGHPGALLDGRHRCPAPAVGLTAGSHTTLVQNVNAVFPKLGSLKRTALLPEPAAKSARRTATPRALPAPRNETVMAVSCPGPLPPRAQHVRGLGHRCCRRGSARRVGLLRHVGHDGHQPELGCGQRRCFGALVETTSRVADTPAGDPSVRTADSTRWLVETQLSYIT